MFIPRRLNRSGVIPPQPPYINDRLVWFDFSDESTITYTEVVAFQNFDVLRNEGDIPVSAFTIQNKGVLGGQLNAVIDRASRPLFYNPIEKGAYIKNDGNNMFFLIQSSLLQGNSFAFFGTMRVYDYYFNTNSQYFFDL